MRVRYSTAADKYYTKVKDDVIRGNYDVKGWRNGLYSMMSVFRKEEHDWNMVWMRAMHGIYSSCTNKRDHRVLIDFPKSSFKP